MKASARERSTRHINEMMARLGIEPGTGAFIGVSVTEAKR
jgi:hypothetical protein